MDERSLISFASESSLPPSAAFLKGDNKRDEAEDIAFLAESDHPAYNKKRQMAERVFPKKGKTMKHTQRIVLLFDGSCHFCTACAECLRLLDWRHCLHCL